MSIPNSNYLAPPKKEGAGNSFLSLDGACCDLQRVSQDGFVFRQVDRLSLQPVLLVLGGE